MAIDELTGVDVPAPGEIRDQVLSDISNQFYLQGINVPIDSGSDWYIEATMVDDLLQQQILRLLLLAADSSELTAVGDALDAHRDALGLPVVSASPSSGNLIVTVTGGGAVAFPDGTEFTLPNGKLGKTNGAQTSIYNGGTVSVVTIDTGSSTNFPAGSKVKWLSPPTNVQVNATVGIDGLTGGTDDETDEQKRNRIINKRKFQPASGNWSYCVQVVEAASAGFQKCCAYPALGGPGSTKLVVQKAIVPGSNYSHQVSDITLAENAIFADFPEFAKVLVQSVVDEPVDVALHLTLPTSNSASSANGWFNSVPFPGLVPADNGYVFVTNVTSTTTITISALGAAPPVAGLSKISWICPANQTLVSSVINSYSGGPSGWVLNLATPLTANGVDVGISDFIFPASFNGQKYLDSWIATFNKIGPGENTAEPFRLPRAARHPFTSDSWGSDLNITQLNAIIKDNPEINDIVYGYRSLTTPTTPVLIEIAPNIFQPNRIGFYKKL